tara:strand:- start:12649 stop:13311 length:663 start_codon:yes stop_codon:yes gene_type:complete
VKITKINVPFPALSIDDFIPSEALLRAAATSFDAVNDDDWVKYGGDAGQVQYCSKNRQLIPPSALLVLDYIASHFDPNKEFENLTTNAFPDTSHYGGGMMVTPNSHNEGGYLGMHVDADVHGVNLNWKREYSAVLCVSEEYDSSFDLLVHDGIDKHARIPYKFNRLNVFKCSENSWHGLPKITEGFDRNTLGVMYWSKMTEEDKKTARVKAKFKRNLEFK